MDERDIPEAEDFKRRTWKMALAHFRRNIPHYTGNMGNDHFNFAHFELDMFEYWFNRGDLSMVEATSARLIARVEELKQMTRDFHKETEKP